MLGVDLSVHHCSSFMVISLVDTVLTGPVHVQEMMSMHEVHLWVHWNVPIAIMSVVTVCSWVWTLNMFCGQTSKELTNPWNQPSNLKSFSPSSNTYHSSPSVPALYRPPSECFNYPSIAELLPFSVSEIDTLWGLLKVERGSRGIGCLTIPTPHTEW